jgi:hypothetical protein
MSGAGGNVVSGRKEHPGGDDSGRGHSSQDAVAGVDPARRICDAVGPVYYQQQVLAEGAARGSRDRLTTRSPGRGRGVAAPARAVLDAVRVLR